MRDPGQVYLGIGMFSRLLGKWEKEYIIYTFMAALRVTAGSTITLRKLQYFSMWSFSLESNWKAWRLGHRREKNGQLRLYNMNNLCKVRGTCEQTAQRKWSLEAAQRAAPTAGLRGINSRKPLLLPRYRWNHPAFTRKRRRILLDHMFV